MGSRGSSSESSKSGNNTKEVTAADLPKIMASNGKASSFATEVRDDVFNFNIRGEKLDITEHMNDATSDRKKYQSVNIYYKDMNRGQRYRLAEFFHNNPKYITVNNGGLGIAVMPKSSSRFRDEQAYKHLVM